jgi:hypothetical protein
VWHHRHRSDRRCRGHAQNQTDATAISFGIALNTDSLTSRVVEPDRVAVGLNVALIKNTADHRAARLVTGNGITVEAVTPAAPATTSPSGHGGRRRKSDVSVAGSIAVQFVDFQTKASVGKGARLTSTGPVNVTATAPLGLQSLALAGAFSEDGNAVGAAIVVNILRDVDTQAFIDSDTTIAGTTHVDATGALSVTATASLAPIVPDTGLDFLTMPALTSVAVSGGAGTGDAAVGVSPIVDVFFLKTKAYIGDGAQINQIGALGSAAQTITVAAQDDTEIVNIAGALGATTGSAGVGLSIIVEVITKDVTAFIGKSALVRAGGSIAVTSSASEDMFELAVAGGASTSAGVAGAILVVLINAVDDHGTLAYIDDNATVHAGGSLDVAATDTAEKLELSAGNVAFGSEAGVGASAVVLVRNGTVDAAIHQGADIQSNGGSGLAVAATQSEDMLLIAIGGAGGGTAGVAGSVVVNVTTNSTAAHIDQDVDISGVGVRVAASDTTTIFSLAGALSFGGTAGVGAGIDVEVITKVTEAWIARRVQATVTGNVVIDAASSEKLTSVAVGGGFGGTAGVNVNVGVSVIDITTNAFIANAATPADAATISANGSVMIAADEKLKLDVIGGNISGGGTAAVGAAAAVPVITKNTHAYIGDNAKVNAAGGGAVTVKTGAFSVTPLDTRFDPTAAGVYDAASDTINLGYAHGLETGEAVLYDDGGGATIPGLTDGGTYYVIKVDATHIKLATSHCGAVGAADPNCAPTTVSAVNLGALDGSALYGESHRIVPSDQAGVRKDESPRFNPQKSGAVNTTTETITLPYELSDVETGDKLIYSSGGGETIGGLVDGQTYYAIKISSTQFKLAPTLCQATGDPAGEDDCDGIAVTPVDLTGVTTNAGKSHSLVKSGTTPSGDASAAGPRTIAAVTESFRGVSVTATNSDDLAAVGVSAGFAGTAR